MEKKEIEDALNKAQLEGETILVIKKRPISRMTDDGQGVEINDGYDFDVNSSIPEIADAIVKLALELPKNGLGKNSDTGFIVYINEFFNRARAELKDKK